MRFKRILLTAVPAALAVLVASITSPAPANADPQISGCANTMGVSACANVGVPVPNINAVANAIPNIPVPNINVPHINPVRGRY
ncbi:MAG: hypothetical protein EBU23_10585 [Mycobacteriaceae bacterium]|nr:hypothetical protein [Mycobacteriaceae bacterium]NBQ42925.1 hypothetical protein [Mycobacteriaceae bacterium]